MSTRIQRAVMMGLVITIGVGTGACLSPLGTVCGDSWCPDGYLCTSVSHVCVRLGTACGDSWCSEGYLCTPVDHVCVEGGCGNTILEADEECDDGNLDDEDSCLSTCQLNRCGDGQVNPRAEACDDGNNNNDDGCTNDCAIGPLAYI